MDIKRLFRFRTYLPKGITGRFVAMSTIPLVLFLLASGYAFYRAHKTDSAAKAALFAGNIATLVDMYREVSDPVEYEDFKKLAMANFNMDVSFEPGAGIPRAKRIAHRLDLLSTRFIEKSLRAKLKYPFVIDADENSSFLGVRIRLPAGVLSANMSLRAVFSKAIYGFAAWIVSAAVLFALIMLPFLRGQIQSIKRLTAAIEKADRGEDISGVKFTGPRQIVDAGRDMIRAYSALKSHLEEKEAMLLGISHDLKTPLARMVLELEFASDKALASTLLEDVEDMRKVIDSYLAFARHSAREKAVKTDLSALVADAVRKLNRGNYDVSVAADGKMLAKVQPNAMARALQNVIGNAIRYGGGRIAVSVARKGRDWEIAVEDDGPGIPGDRREEMLRPFARMDESRNAKTGGVGLGLAIVRDIIRSHGGSVALGSGSSLGGLKVTMKFPA